MLHLSTFNKRMSIALGLKSGTMVVYAQIHIHNGSRQAAAGELRVRKERGGESLAQEGQVNFQSSWPRGKEAVETRRAQMETEWSDSVYGTQGCL